MRRLRGAGQARTEHVARGLGGAVRGAGLVRGALGELRRVVEGPNRRMTSSVEEVVVADAVLMSRLEQARNVPSTLVRRERLGVGDGVVVVGLCGVVHDGVVAGDDALQKLGVADVAHQLDAVGGKARDVLAVARVGELVEHGHVHLGMLAHHMVHENCCR